MNRRGFVSAVLAAPFLSWAGTLLAKTAQFPVVPPPGSQQFPGDDPRNPPRAKLDPHAALKQYQKEIKKDVGRLYDLAGKLRKQVEQTDSSEVLSLGMIHTAEEIEKLAKHIKDLARA